MKLTEKDRRIIEKALAILHPFACQEKEEDAYQIVILKKDQEVVPDEEEYSFYCKNCIDKEIKRYRKEHPKNHLKVDYIPIDLGEEENWEFCESCGDRLEISLLIGDQELEHWEEQWKEKKCYGIKNIGIAFELHEILDSLHCIIDNQYFDQDLIPRIIQIAKNIIEESNQEK
jgi:predicted RNA-binding Zn-ribbon protein involved in translation (DUF1610 family)